jgi:hypothetical protein
MPIWCHHRRESRCLFVILIHRRRVFARMLAHLSPNVEMPHRALKHVQAVEHLIDVLRADVLLRFAEDCP